MNRTYELMFIVRPDMADEDLEKLISKPGVDRDVRCRLDQERGPHGQTSSGVHGAQVPRGASTF